MALTPDVPGIVNEYLSCRRKWSQVVPIADVPGPVGADPASGIDARAELITEINKLPRRQRAVVAIRFFADLTDAEIAADLGCSEGTVRSHASRALAAVLGEHHPAGPDRRAR